MALSKKIDRQAERLILALVFLLCQSIIPTQTQADQFTLPVLPVDGKTYGGCINLDKCQNDFSNALAADGKLDLVGTDADFCGKFIDNGKNQVFFGKSTENSLAGRPSVLMTDDSNGSRPTLLLSEDALYLRECGMVCFEDKKGFLNFYDLSIEKLMHSMPRDKVSNIFAVSSDKILLDMAGVFELYDTRKWNRVLTCDKTFAWDEKTFVSKDKIVSLDGSGYIKDIGEFKITSKPVFDGNFVYAASPNSSGKSYSMLKLTRSGSLVFRKDVAFLYPMNNFELSGVRDNLALIKTGVEPKVKWTVFSFPDSQLKWESNSSADNPLECRFIESVLVQKSRNGLEVFEVSELKTPTLVSFSSIAEFFVSDDKKFVSTNGFDLKGKPKRIVYQLVDDNSMVESSKTLINNDVNGVYPLEGGFVAVKFEPARNSDGFINANKYRFSFYRLGSDRSYKDFSLSFPSECPGFPKTSIIDGQFYVQRESRIEAVNLLDETKKTEYQLDGWFSTSMIPNFYKRGDRLFVHIPKDPDMDSSQNTVMCFDLLSSKLIFKQVIKESSTIAQVEQDFVLIDDNTGTDFAVLRVSGQHVQKKDSLAVVGRNLLFKRIESSDKFTKTFLGKMNLMDNSQQLFEMGCSLEKPSMLFGGSMYINCTGFVSEYGAYVQNTVGCWRGFFENKSGQYILDGSKAEKTCQLLGEGGCDTIARLAPCPTFGVVRRSTNQFEVTATGKDGLPENLAGKMTAVYWSDEGEMPPFVKLNKFNIKIEDIKPGQTAVINIDKYGLGKVMGKRTTRMALIFDTNGLLDTLNSDSTPMLAKTSPLFDGIPLSLKSQRALCVAVYKRQVSNH